MQQLRIHIGGDNQQKDLTTITIDGCPCRLKPFVAALREFVGDWKARADQNENTITINGQNPDGKSPCGCQGE
jgi:hypothetical protein